MDYLVTQTRGIYDMTSEQSVLKIDLLEAGKGAYGKQYSLMSVASTQSTPQLFWNVLQNITKTQRC